MLNDGTIMRLYVHLRIVKVYNTYIDIQQNPVKTLIMRDDFCLLISTNGFGQNKSNEEESEEVCDI